MVPARAKRPSRHAEHPEVRFLVSAEGGAITDATAPHPSTSTRVADIDGKGRGVVAARGIAAGELIERAPVIVVPARDVDIVSKTVLDGYVYDWGKDASELAVALGHGSLFNHSFEPNVLYIKHAEARVIEYRAIHDIAAGEELLINYNGAIDDRSPMWFEVR